MPRAKQRGLWAFRWRTARWQWQARPGGPNAPPARWRLPARWLRHRYCYCIRVALDLPLHRLFDYVVGSASADDVGYRVRVPFGKGERIGVIAGVADTLRPQAVQAVAELRALGITPIMLTGDHAAAAHAAAREAGIDEVHASLLPEDKLTAIAALQQTHGMTAMAGDGINDAPALAQADIGFAMGGAGTDVAMETADVVIMNDDLRRVAETVRLSHRTHSVLVQNIALAIGIKAVFLVLALFGQATMWMAVFADMGASLLVVANGLRMLRQESAVVPVPTEQFSKASASPAKARTKAANLS